MSPRSRKPRRVAVGAPECATTWPARSESNLRTEHAKALHLATVAMLDAALGMVDCLAALTDAPAAATVAAADALDLARNLLTEAPREGAAIESGQSSHDRAQLPSRAKRRHSRGNGRTFP